jgi:glycosyltransferase involved in cell wall biosynthesis
MIVDIGTTVWNRPSYTDKFLKSIVDSNLDNYRLFILDQNSNEETYNVIRKYDRPNFIHVRLDENIGACAGRVRLYKMMISKYVILTDNDIVVPKNCGDMVKRQIEILDSYENIQCVVPTPTTAGKGSLVGRCMNFAPYENAVDFDNIEISGTLMMAHRRDNLISAQAYVVPKYERWNAWEHIQSKHYISQGWKYVCMRNFWIDVQEANETWGYDKNDIVDYKDKYDKNQRIWDVRAVIANQDTLEPKWYVDKIEAWDQKKEYIRNANHN